jgi:hypothetical protein
MSILQEILKWSRGLPPWQQDAIARLYSNRELSREDFEDILALLKVEHGIADPGDRKPSKLREAEVAAPPLPNRLVQLAAIKDLRNVNALAEGQRLPLGPDGLTVIFGSNGAGKSGYSRVLKQACRARQPGRRILPDARKTADKTGPAQAAFEALVNGAQVELTWTFGTPAPEQLSEIAIFDSQCARAYLDNEGDFAYAPYGLDILKGLVKTCHALHAAITKEKAANTPSVDLFATLAKTSTKVGKMLGSLSKSTPPSDVENLSALNAEESARHADVAKILAETDPKQKAQILRRQAERMAGLAGRISAAVAVVDDAKLGELRTLVSKSNTAKAAARLAAKQFGDTPGMLPGTGGDAWKSLFEAARAFAAESHEADHFPDLDPDSSCPLCQNTLGPEGAARLAAFDAFVQREAEKEAARNRAAAAAAFTAIQRGNLDLLLDATLRQELHDISPEVAGLCDAMQAGLSTRRDGMVSASGGSTPWDEVAPIPANPCDRLMLVVGKHREDAKGLEDSVNETGKAALVTEHAELDARRRLAELKAHVLDAIEKFTLVAKLDSCALATKPTAISSKSTSLSNTMAIQEVADALNEELRSLNVHTLRAAMKSESPGGEIKYKLILELPGGGEPSEILSEGEQRAVAIASFLTEVRLGKGRGGIIFDDPVSSLDHVRRERVAKRLAKESLDRQVIVLTHDLFFLNLLRGEAERLGSTGTYMSLRRTQAGFGVPDPDLPFAGASTRQRVGMLRQMHVECAKLEGDDAAYEPAARRLYDMLRRTWERAVEELLFNKVVQRFDSGVQTLRLRNVTVTPSDLAIVEDNMAHCSAFTGHDGADAAQVAIPTADEILARIKTLDDWRDELTKRLNVKT